MTTSREYANTFLFISSVGWVSLNASWDSPVFTYGCAGIVVELINELRKRCLKKPVIRSLLGPRTGLNYNKFMDFNFSLNMSRNESIF